MAIKKIQQDILQWDIFKDLGALDSSSRFYEEGGFSYPYQEHASIANDKIPPTAPSSMASCPGVSLTCPVGSLYLSGLFPT
jgi:hypothetical protein